MSEIWDGPAAALLGTYNNGNPTPMMWSEMITETPMLGDTELWEIYNFTADAHPIHLHLVGFQVVNRQTLTNVDDEGVAEVPAFPDDDAQPRGPEPWETGLKDTVIAYPGRSPGSKPPLTNQGFMSGTATLSSMRITR